MVSEFLLYIYFVILAIPAFALSPPEFVCHWNSQNRCVGFRTAHETCTHVFPCPQDIRQLPRCDPFTLDHDIHHHDSHGRGLYHLSSPYTSNHRRLDSCNHEPYQPQSYMDDPAWLYDRHELARTGDGHIVGCPCPRHSPGRELGHPSDIDLIDSLLHGCPPCWRDHGRDYIPNFYSRPSYEHLELPSLIRASRDLDTAASIVKSNLNACLRNRTLRSRDMEGLLYPMRNRYGLYPDGFDDPRPLSWFRALSRAQRERMLRDYDLPYELEDLLDLGGYPRDLSYPSSAQDTLQVIALAEAVGARRAREEMEVEEMAPLLRSLGRHNFDGIGFGGLSGRLGDGLGFGRGLDRLYRPMLRNQGLPLDNMADLMLSGMLSHPGMGRLGAGRMGPGLAYGGVGRMGMPYSGMGSLGGYPTIGGRRRMGMTGMRYSSLGMGMGSPYGQFGGGYGWRGSGLAMGM